MILVDVVFPELDQAIDFQLDETVQGWDIVEEIASIAAKFSSRSYEPGSTNALLYSVDKQRMLDLNRSLKSNGIRSGDKLLFI